MTFASDAIIAPAPIAYSSFYTDELKPGYEYSTAVNTPTYNNYAHVRSGGEVERKFYNFPQYAAPFFAESAEPFFAETRFLQPAPVLKSNLAIAARADVVAAAPVAVAPVPAIAAAAPAVPAPATKLVPFAFEPKPFEPRLFPFYRFLAPAPAVVAGKFLYAKKIILFQTNILDHSYSDIE